MKEVTYEDWQKNPIPRMMWVYDDYDDYDSEKKKRKVVYILSGVKGKKYNVLTVSDKEINTVAYTHCAEIEKQRRMTNKELSRWLREKPTRECKYTFDAYVYSVHTYDEDFENEEVDKDVVIREDDGEWREPLVKE